MKVLFVGRFAPDEPVHEVLEAARTVPQVEVEITGERERAPDQLVAEAPSNVRFVGFLDEGEYAEAMGESDAVLTLTTEPASVMRSAYEAVYANRPLIVSDWPALRELFPFAIHVDNEADAISLGMQRAASERNQLGALAARARELQTARWASQRESLQARLRPERGPRTKADPRRDQSAATQ